MTIKIRPRNNQNGEAPSILGAAMAGVVATYGMDVAGRRIVAPALGKGPSGGLGRWIGHMLQGRFTHEDITTAAPVAHEAAIGVVAHYAIGLVLGRTASRTSTEDISSGRRGGQRSGRPGPRGRTRDQLYAEATRLNVTGRSRMNKEQLRKAVDAKT